MNLRQLIILICITISFNGLAQDFKTCKPEVAYGVDNYQLSEKHPGLKTPKNSPYYEDSDGILLIKKHFENTKLNPEKSKETVFRSHIAFVVNCEGIVGNYEILGNNTGTERELEEELLTYVKAIPSKWHPAVFKGENVDCYQVLVFTVMNGVITNIFYK